MAFYPRKVWTEKYSSIYRLVFCKLIYYQTILNKMNELYKIIVHTDIPKPHSHIKYLLKSCPASWFTFHSKDERFSDNKSENENDKKESPDKQPDVEPKEEKPLLSERRNQGSFVVKMPDKEEDPAECKHKKLFIHTAEENDVSIPCDKCENNDITKDIGYGYMCKLCNEIYCRTCMLKWDKVDNESEEVPLEKIPDFVPEPTGTPPNSWVPGQEIRYSNLKKPEDYLEAGEIAKEEKRIEQAMAEMEEKIIEQAKAEMEEKRIEQAMAEMEDTGTSSTVVPDNSPGVSNSPDGQNSPDGPNSSDAPNSQESPLDYVIGIENQEPLDILDPD